MVYLPSEQYGGLLIDRYEVTDEEYHDFVRDTGYDGGDEPAFLLHWSADQDGRRAPRRPHTPVRFVNREDAEAYARWCGKQLPSREQWMLASRAIEEDQLPWWGEPEPPCNTYEFGWGDVCPVGVFARGRSESNCYDLIGNVAEWVRSEGFGGQCYKMGGSFNSVLYPTTNDPIRKPTAGEPPPFSIQGELQHSRDRTSDIGFRCVIEDAAPILRQAIERLAELRGRDRRAAIQELLDVGASMQRRDPNKILPFVKEAEFRSRILWSVPLAAAADVHRSPVDLGGDAREDLLVVVKDSEARQYELQARDGADGSLLGAVPIPPSWPRSRGVVTRADGASVFWCEAEDGAIQFVRLPSLQPLILAPSTGDQTSTKVAVVPLGGGLLVLQSLERMAVGGHPGADRMRTRLCWYDEAGAVSSLELPGGFKDVQDRGAGRIELTVVERFPVQLLEPFQDAASQLGPVLCSTQFTLRPVPGEGLQVLARHRLAPEPIREQEQVARVKASAPGLDAHGRYFSAPPPAKDGRSLLVVGGELRSARGGESMDWFDLVLLDEGLQELARERWEMGPGTVLRPSTEPGLWLGLEEGRRPFLVEARRDGFRRIDLADQVKGLRRCKWWSEGPSDPVQPLLLADDPGDRLHLRRLQRVGESWRLQRHGPAEGLPARSGNRVATPGPSVSRVLSFKPSELVLLDPAGELAWSVRLAPAAEGATLGFVEHRRDREQRALLVRAGSNAWIHSMEDGRVLDHLEIRTPLPREAMADVAGDARREWVLVLDGQVLDPGQPGAREETWLVAVDGPRPGSPEARLVEEFQEMVALDQPVPDR